MKKKMGISLIIIGTLSIVFGIVMVSSGKNEARRIGTLQDSQSSETSNSGVEERSVALQQSGMALSGSSDLETAERRDPRNGEKTLSDLSDTDKGGEGDLENNPDATGNKADASASGNNFTAVGKGAGQDAKQKGNDFEGFMADVLKANNIRLKEWNQGTTSPDGAYAENELNPDFLVAHRDDNLEYWVECKYRSALSVKGFSLDEAQLGRYHKIQGRSKKKVLIALGVGGTAASPEKLYVIPIDTLVRFKFVGPKFLPSYSLNDPKANFKGYVKDWFYKEVFKRNKE